VIRDTGVSFTDYLEAKMRLDSESLHRPTFELFIDLLDNRGEATLVDLGTGTGAMLRRIAMASRISVLRSIGIDSDEDGLAVAEEKMSVAVRNAGRSRASGSYEFQTGDLLLPATQRRLRDIKPDAVTAHALMDCLPLDLALVPIAEALPRRGLFYASLNYDGRTDIFPSFRDSGFEARILEIYDASMNERLVDGRPIAGSRSGRRIYEALPSVGLTPISVGASDWSLSPTRAVYRPYIRTVLFALLGMIYAEMVEQSNAGRSDITIDALDRWYQDRMHAVEERRLAAVVHQIDVLASRS
jgi:hypothetical protein